jgi:hypothetical protein
MATAPGLPCSSVIQSPWLCPLAKGSQSLPNSTDRRTGGDGRSPRMPRQEMVDVQVGGESILIRFGSAEIRDQGTKEVRRIHRARIED